MIKTLFSFCLPVLIASTQIACTKPTAMNAPSGGIDGGGGGTLPAKPISDYEFDKVIETAKRDLGLFVKYSLLAHARYGKNVSEVDKKLYDGPKTIWDVLQTTDLEIRKDRACKDAYGNERDASIYASTPNTICVSSYRINPKTVAERAKIEIYALLMHELSHILGTTEAEAQEYQGEVAFYFSSELNRSTDGEKFVTSAFDALEDLERNVYRVNQAFDTLSNEEISKAYSEMLSSFSKAFATSFDPPFSIYSQDEADLFNVHHYQTIATFWATEMLLPGESMGKTQLKEIFGDQDEITLREFQLRQFGNVANESVYNNIKIRKLKSRTEVKAATEELLQFTFRAQARLYQFRFGNRPNNFRPLPLTAGPWAAFQGRYTVVNSQCSNGNTANRTAYEVVERSPTDFHLIEYFENGHGDTGGLYDGATVFSASNFVTVSGANDWAERLDEAGDLWSPHGGRSQWQQHSIRIERSESGEYQMTEKTKFRRFIYTGPNEDSETTCVLQLRKES
jgi:hypothetical protein